MNLLICVATLHSYFVRTITSPNRKGTSRPDPPLPALVFRRQPELWAPHGVTNPCAFAAASLFGGAPSGDFCAGASAGFVVVLSGCASRLVFSDAASASVT